MRDRAERGAMRKVAGAISFIPAILVVDYGFERVWVTAFEAGLPLWGVRGVVVAFVSAVILCASLILTPAIQVLLERLVASRTAHADESGPGS